MALRSWGGAERRCSDEIVVVILGAFCTQSATHSGTDCRRSALVPSGTHSQRTVEQIVDAAVPKEILNAVFGALERAKLPYFGHFARSDVEGLDGLHQLVWAVEAGGRTVISPRCGFSRGPVHWHRAQLGASPRFIWTNTCSVKTHVKTTTTTTPPPHHHHHTTTTTPPHHHHTTGALFCSRLPSSLRAISCTRP